MKKIYKAIDKGDLTNLQALLNANNINTCNWHLDNFLHYAAAKGNIAVNDLLVDMGVNYNASNAAGLTPIDVAIKEKRLAIFSYFLFQLPSILQQRVGGMGLIHRAAKYGTTEFIRLLIQEDVNLNEATDRGSTALHIAAQRGDSDMCYLLADHNANINARDSWGNTPLHKAVINDHVHVVILLASLGATLNVENSNSRNPASYSRSPMMAYTMETLYNGCTRPCLIRPAV